MKNLDRKSRTGSVRKGSRGAQVGSGGQGRQALEGKKPTPKAEDRPYHPAGKRKAAAERFTAAGGFNSRPAADASANRGGARGGPAARGGARGASQGGPQRGTGNTGGGGS